MTWHIHVSRQRGRPPWYAFAYRRQGNVVYGFNVEGWTLRGAAAKAQAKINGGWTKP